MIDVAGKFFLFHRKFLLLALLKRNLNAKYRGSILGFFWTLLVPMAQVVIFYYLFKVILKIETPNYLAFMVVGLIPWYFFSSTMTESMEALVSSRSLITHVAVPLQAFPAASVFGNIVGFVAALPILLGALFLDGVSLTWNALWIFPLCLILFFYVYGLAFILSTLFVVLRDLKHMFSLFLQLWLYATPILYPVSMVPERFEWILKLNPLSGYFISMRNVLVEGQVPELFWVMHFSVWTLATLVFAIAICNFYSYRLVERL